MDEATAEAVRRWLQKADNDLRAARAALEADPPITDIACFHAQQCAEKALKAFLVFAGTHVERTHDLPRLLACCVRHDAALSSLSEIAARLADYAVATRYPDDWREIPEHEAYAAITDAVEVRRCIQERLTGEYDPVLGWSQL